MGRKYDINLHTVGIVKKFAYGAPMPCGHVSSTPFFKNPKVLSSKSKDIKTLVDIEMNKCIVENLKSTQFSIISEEIEKRPTKIPNQCWIIDPLDGTYNFTRKFPVVGISIAFFDNVSQLGRQHPLQLFLTKLTLVV